VLTDDKDFGELVVRQGLPVQGVILVRLEGVDPARRAEIVSNAIRAHESELVGGFMVVTSSRIRIRRLHA
jgi:predicted nuclease of predicted toxin-antitoxin system